MDEKKKGALVVIAVDKDNDIGRKTGIEGPIIGEKANLDVAVKLALEDPGETDANCIFAALKAYKYIKGQGEDVEIVTITGSGKNELEADRKINEQLDMVKEILDPRGFVLVTDGAEDATVMPLIQSRAPIISKQTVIIKQAPALESTYYTLKEVLRDPHFSKLFLGVPGIIILLLLIFGSYGWYIIFFILGFYLFIKGFKIDELAYKAYNSLKSSFSLQNPAVVFYVTGIVIFLFALGVFYQDYLFVGISGLKQLFSSLQKVYFLFFFSLIVILVGKIVQYIHFKKAYKLKFTIFSIFSSLALWILIDASTSLMLGDLELIDFLPLLFFANFFVFTGYYVSQWFDISKEPTSLLVGLKAFSKFGTFLGDVISVDKKKGFIEIKDEKRGKTIKVKKGSFLLVKDKVVLQ